MRLKNKCVNRGANESFKDDALEKALKKYSDLVQLYEVKGGYDIEEKLGKVCTGLKFKESFLNKDFNLLSGGEKTTVMLRENLIDNRISCCWMNRQIIWIWIRLNGLKVF